MSKGGLSWSVQGWLLESPENKSAPKKNLSFAELSHAIFASINEANEVAKTVVDAVERNKLEEQLKVLRSAAAQYVNAGNKFASDPSPANEESMKNSDKVMGHAHSQLKKMIEVHQKGGQGVNKPPLLAEQAAAVKEVQAWRGQIELMQIDASSFEVAYKRLSRVNNSLVKSFVSDNIRKDLLLKQQANWDLIAQRYADIFMPPEEQKWNSADVFGDEDKVFDGLADLQKQIGASI